VRAVACTVSGHKSKRKTSKPRFYAFLTNHQQQMKLPGAQRQPLGEVSPNQRSRVVSARDHGIRYPVIARMEQLNSQTCRSIVANAPHQVSCITPKRNGAPALLTEGDIRLIRRAITINPKITAQQLKVSCADHVSKKTIYRYLKKSGIQKWRAKQRPLLTPEHAAMRMAWALKYDGKPVEFWRRLRWSDECSIERGKGGAIQWVYRRRGKTPPPSRHHVPLLIILQRLQVKLLKYGQSRPRHLKGRHKCFGPHSALG